LILEGYSNKKKMSIDKSPSIEDLKENPFKIGILSSI